MKSYDYEAVVIDGAVWCDNGKCAVYDAEDERQERITPIFADSEWDHYPVCEGCGTEHDYVSLTDEGRAALAAPDEMVRGYLDCAVFASSNDEGESLEYLNFGPDDFSADADEQARKDCDDFWKANRADLTATRATPEQHGHDFWLTRNHHGAGFWDRGYEAGVSKRLTDAAHAYGSADVRISSTYPGLLDID